MPGIRTCVPEGVRFGRRTRRGAARGLLVESLASFRALLRPSECLFRAAGFTAGLSIRRDARELSGESCGDAKPSGVWVHYCRKFWARAGGRMSCRRSKLLSGLCKCRRLRDPAHVAEHVAILNRGRDRSDAGWIRQRGRGLDIHHVARKAGPAWQFRL